MRMTLAHELGHLVMDAMTLVSPTETERRATAFAAEFLAPIDDIAFDLDRVSIRTVHELDELRLTWGVSVSSLVMRARERGVLPTTSTDLCSDCSTRLAACMGLARRR
jgi:Zn-dependent peptidase ImmA (M78 family)